jgi:hypothetical protein
MRIAIRLLLAGIWAVAVSLPGIPEAAAGTPGVPASGDLNPGMERDFSLGEARTPEPHYFLLETKLLSFAEDGARTPGEIFRLYLACTEPGSSPDAGDRYVCRKLTVRMPGGEESRIPALDGWSYLFRRTTDGKDAKGQLFGIDHATFENLSDAAGKLLTPDVAYAVYNTFIDFHAFCNALAEPTSQGIDIRSLRRIGQRIVHSSAYSEPPVNVGSAVAEGSKFKNGEVALELKGVSVTKTGECAIVGFDSGESSFVMLMKPAPNTEVRTTGASHYQGDFYIDLATHWVEKVVMGEIVVAKVTMGDQNLAHTVMERALTVRSLSKEEFERD